MLDRQCVCRNTQCCQYVSSIYFQLHTSTWCIYIVGDVVVVCFVTVGSSLQVSRVEVAEFSDRVPGVVPHIRRFQSCRMVWAVEQMEDVLRVALQSGQLSVSSLPIFFLYWTKSLQCLDPLDRVSWSWHIGNVKVE